MPKNRHAITPESEANPLDTMTTESYLKFKSNMEKARARLAELDFLDEKQRRKEKEA